MSIVKSKQKRVTRPTTRFIEAQGRPGCAMIVYGLKNCDTCRKAVAALEGAVLCDLRAEGLPDAVLDEALARFGAALVNTRSATWRGLDDRARQQDPRSLLRAHPALMKRPLIAAGGRLWLGWTDETRADLLG